MSVQFQLRRGTTAQIGAITPASGEILWDTTIGRVVVGNGTLAGGLAAPYDVNGFVSSPKGIQFPAVQVPSGGVNVLDDYEEGTWTPTITFGGAGVGITYTIQVGTYTKIGRVVTIQGYVRMSSNGSSVGALLIAGLPFVSAATTNDFTALAGYEDAILTGLTGISRLVNTGATTISFRKTVSGLAATMSDTDCTNTTGLIVSGSYHT